MLMATRARSIRRISSASSSAPRAVNTRVSPIFLQRSWAGVPSKTEGKSSGTMIAGRSGTSLLRVGEGGLGGRDAGAVSGAHDENTVARLDHRQGAGLERRAPRARHDDHLVRRLEDLAQRQRRGLEDLLVEAPVVLD